MKIHFVSHDKYFSYQMSHITVQNENKQKVYENAKSNKILSNPQIILNLAISYVHLFTASSSVDNSI